MSYVAANAVIRARRYVSADAGNARKSRGHKGNFDGAVDLVIIGLKAVGEGVPCSVRSLRLYCDYLKIEFRVAANRTPARSNCSAATADFFRA